MIITPLFFLFFFDQTAYPVDFCLTEIFYVGCERIHFQEVKDTDAYLIGQDTGEKDSDCTDDDIQSKKDNTKIGCDLMQIGHEIHTHIVIVVNQIHGEGGRGKEGNDSVALENKTSKPMDMSTIVGET